MGESNVVIAARSFSTSINDAPHFFAASGISLAIAESSLKASNVFAAPPSYNRATACCI